jgi:hypothetical protein
MTEDAPGGVVDRTHGAGVRAVPEVKRGHVLVRAGPSESVASNEAHRGSVGGFGGPVVAPPTTDWQPIDLVIGGGGGGDDGATGIRPSASSTSIASATSGATKPSPRRYTVGTGAGSVASGPVPVRKSLSGESDAHRGSAGGAAGSISREPSISAFQELSPRHAGQERSGARSRGAYDDRLNARSPLSNLRDEDNDGSSSHGQFSRNNNNNNNSSNNNQFNQHSSNNNNSYNNNPNFNNTSLRGRQQHGRRQESEDVHVPVASSQSERNIGIDHPVRSLSQGPTSNGQPIAQGKFAGWDGGFEAGRDRQSRQDRWQDNGNTNNNNNNSNRQARSPVAVRHHHQHHEPKLSPNRQRPHENGGTSPRPRSRAQRSSRGRRDREVSRSGSWIPAGPNDRPGLRGLEESRREREYLALLRAREEARRNGDGYRSDNGDCDDDHHHHNHNSNSNSNRNYNDRLGDSSRDAPLRSTNARRPSGATFGLPVRVCDSASCPAACARELEGVDAIDINFICNAQSWRPLHVAARLGHADCILDLISRGSYVNVCDSVHRTPLHIAAYHGHIGAVRALLDRGAMVDAQTVYGDTALHVAATKGYRDIVRALVTDGAEVYLPNASNMLPHEVATVQVAKHLLETITEHAQDSSPKRGTRSVLRVGPRSAMRRSIEARDRTRRVNVLSGSGHGEKTLGWVPPSEARDSVMRRFDYPCSYSFF